MWDQIDNWVSNAVYEKFERFRLEQGLAAMEDVRFCPKPGTVNTILHNRVPHGYRLWCGDAACTR
jgi:hypothetical protein